MKSKLLPIVSAVVAAVLVAAPSTSFAKKYTPAQFNTELKKQLGTKTGPAAYNKAGAFLKTALSDKNNKKFVVSYTNFVIKALGKAVKTPLRGNAANTLVKNLLIGYFKGLKFNINDGKYNSALTKILHFIPQSQKTAATSQKIYNSIKTFALPKGLTQSQVFSYFQPVAQRNRLPEPVS